MKAHSMLLPPRNSLAFRLLALVALSQLVLAAILLSLGLTYIRRQALRAFDAELAGRLMSVAALVRYPEQGATPLEFDAQLLPRESTGPVPAQPDFYAVFDADGHTLVSTFPASVRLPQPPTSRQPLYWSLRAGGDYRGVIVSQLPILDSEEDITGPPALLTVAYAEPAGSLERQLVREAWGIGGASLLALLLSLLLAAFLARRALRPLRDVAAQAAAISARNWRFDPPPEAAGTAELAPLISALALMLQRLRAAYQHQREFLADAAHELKTPVAILKSTLQSLLHHPRPEAEYHSAASASLADVERLEALLQRMLRLAQVEQWSEEGRSRPLSPVELAGTCESALLRVAPLARARGVELPTRPAGDARPWHLLADPDDLELVWINLLENAVQHSSPGSAVRLEIRDAAEGAPAAVVAIEDHGSGIADSEIESVFERFHRGESDRAAGRPGFGLGLAIARAIVQAYGGRIEARSRLGHGTCMLVTLPGRASSASVAARNSAQA